MKAIDFDALFQRYFERWYAENKDSVKNADEAERAMPAIYDAWLAQPLKELGNASPSSVFSKEPTEELIRLMEIYLEKEIPLPDILCETVAARSDAAELLSAALKSSKNAEFAVVLMNLLNEGGHTGDYGWYADRVLDKQSDPAVRELAVEILAADPAGARRYYERILDGADKADEETRLMVADIIVNDFGNDHAYRFLCRVFQDSDDLALAASYLAKFGDDRALPMLQEAIAREEINYAEFVELRNAVESLGGEVRQNRSFESDPYYAALKGLKH